MSLARCLVMVTLNTKPLNLTKVAAMCNLFRLDVIVIDKPLAKM
jgi:hypothetical protein